MVWGNVKQITSKVNIVSSIITLPKPKLPIWEPPFQNFLPLTVLKSFDGKKHDKHTYLNIWCFHFGPWRAPCPFQFSSVTQSCPTLCDPMNCSTPGLPVHHQLLEFTQTHVHRVSDAIQPSHPQSSASPPAPNPSQHQSLFQWVNSSHEVAKVLEFQL